MKRQWTQEQRAMLASQIQQWKPWTRSTGPKTTSGKAKVTKNAYKGERRPKHRAAIRTLKLALDIQSDFVDALDV